MPTLETKSAVSFKNILAATDFSTASKVALKYAAAFAKLHGSKIYVTHVLPPVPRSFIPLEPVPPELDAERKQADHEMSDFLADGSVERIPHETLMERGAMRSVLPELIQEREIDLVVLGTHGRNGISTVVLGSVAEEIFRLVSCPVLTVGPTALAEPRDTGHIRRILFATDFGSASLAALPYAISLAKEDNAKLIMLHVMRPLPSLDAGLPWYSRADMGDKQEAARQRTRDRLAQLISKGEGLASPPDFLVPLETLPWGILNIAEESKADVIVMGVKRAVLASASAHMPWAIAHGIVRHARCPVLTVRSGL
jgi:nucleotide-binding universal stress UspA family protein